MRTARFFIPAEWLAKSSKAFCIPVGSLHKQITTVLRLKIGDPLSLMINDGEEHEGHITEITRSAIMGTIVSSKKGRPVSPTITLCAAITKRDTFEWTLQKCTELGVSKFIPLLTDRVIKRPSEVPKRWHDIVREASEQSGRTTLPIITEPMKFGEAIAATEKCIRIFMHESGGQKLPTLNSSNHLALFIGPEGGFTEPELTLAHDVKAPVVTLGDLVLRAETAAIVGTTLLRFA